ncbi:hypothetical protein BDB01DRAFT_878405 [Pilobolus umbonatus]|nr:hypothetical protein BDB01DRAFT_878405 [Pilobolus umbonatus]
MRCVQQSLQRKITMTSPYNYYHEEDDDTVLADIVSLKLIEEKNNAVDSAVWNDWIMQNRLYQHHQQLESSYYQLQYLHQRQMMTMMKNNQKVKRSCTVKSNSSNYSHNINHRSKPISPSSSNSSIQLQRSRSDSNHNTITHPTNRSRNSNHEKSNNRSHVIIPEPPKRRQSLGKRLKQVFGLSSSSQNMTVKEAELPKHEQMNKQLLETSNKHKKVSRSIAGQKIVMPDSPDSSISSRKHSSRISCYDNNNNNNNCQSLPSPASSTVSSLPAPIKKTVAFSPVVKLHETFSPVDYDRKSDINATCQNLTPILALKIKEELNHYKLTDMYVHMNSRQYTHFFL